MTEELNEDQIEQQLDLEAKKLEQEESQEAQTVQQKPGLTIRDTQASALLDPNTYIQMKGLAKDFIDSKAIPNCWGTASQVLVGLQTGLEMGMKPMEAMNSLYPVNGAINVWGKATTRRLREHGYSIKYSKESQEEVTCTVSKGSEKYTETYLFQDAVDSGYTADNFGKPKFGWKKGMNRKKKLRYGVLSLIINTYIPEVLGSAMGIVELADDHELADGQAKQIEDVSDRRKKMIDASNNFKKESKDKVKAVENDG